MHGSGTHAGSARYGVAFFVLADAVMAASASHKPSRPPMG